MNNNLKAQSIYILRQMWRMESARVTTLEALKETIEKYENQLEEHNASYGDNANTSIYFVDEKTIAQNYPL